MQENLENSIHNFENTNVIIMWSYFSNKLLKPTKHRFLICTNLLLSNSFLIEIEFMCLSWVQNHQNLIFKVNFLCQKSSESFQKFFSLKNMKLGAQFLLMTLFAYCNFWSTLFTKIGPKLQTLIPNQALICQRPFLVRKCLFPFN